jgi:hypothetical protein
VEFNEQGFFPAETESKLAVGIDIGFSNDNSVAVTVERLRVPLDPTIEGSIGTDLQQKLGEPQFIVRGCVIFPLQTPFAAVIEHAKRIQAALDRDAEILVDCTGSLPFAEQARAARLDFTQVSITGGAFDKVDIGSEKTSVSKSALVTEVDAALTRGGLIIPNDLPGMDALRLQLDAFKMGRSPITGQAVWGGKRQKDDALMALSYALFALRTRRGNEWSVEPMPF